MVIFKSRDAAAEEVARIKRAIAENLVVEPYISLIGAWNGFRIAMYNDKGRFAGYY